MKPYHTSSVTPETGLTQILRPGKVKVSNHSQANKTYPYPTNQSKEAVNGKDRGFIDRNYFPNTY